MSAANMRDALVLRDFAVFINGIGKIGQCPSFTPPEYELEMEDYRGGGMDGTVEIPMGINKMDTSFDLHTWDADIWQNTGYGAGSMDVPLLMLGAGITYNGAQQQISISMRGALKSIKTDAIVPGKIVKMVCAMSVNKYTHTIAGKVVTDIDVFAKTTLINGVDVSATARGMLGFTY